MIDWKSIYKQIINKYHTPALLFHLSTLIFFFILGYIVGYILYDSLAIFAIYLVIGASISAFLAWQGPEVAKRILKRDVYIVDGMIEYKAIVKSKSGTGKTINKYYFDLESQDAKFLTKEGLGEKYPEKEEIQRVEIEKKIFDRYHKGHHLVFICDPDDKAWGMIDKDNMIHLGMGGRKKREEDEE